MGNKLVSRRQLVDEKYTKPKGLYQHKNVDHKKLRKLILASKLAPCYPGDDECGASDLDECPICFLYYPSLNRSRCCLKGICTECFLQMKTPDSTRPAQCPFCKTSNYAVEYRGVKSKEEKRLEQIEEQRAIAANIRIRQQELQDEEQKDLKHREEPCTVPVIRPMQQRQNREDEFNLDLEDIMVMRAIWLPIQENGRRLNPVYSEPSPSELHAEEQGSSTTMAPAAGSSSPSGNLVCALAALAERQQIVEETSSISDYDTIPGCSDRDFENFSAASPGIQMPTMAICDREWVDNISEIADDATLTALPSQEDESGHFQPVVGPVVPETFEEQMMLVMAVSLAEARARSTTSHRACVQLLDRVQ